MPVLGVWAMVWAEHIGRMDTMEARNRNNIGIIGGLVLALLPVGCGQDPTADSVVVIVEPSSRPMLTASQDSQISLFGGLPRRGESHYIGRARGALLQHSFTREGGDFDPHFDSSGDRFVFSSTRHTESPDLYIKSERGTAVTQLTSDPGHDIQPCFDPEGRRVAFASNRTGNWDIWVVGLDGQHAVQITNTPMHEVHPSWSPDGTRVVYSALPERSGTWELWVSPVEQHATSTFIGHGVYPEWSPIDDRILFQRSRQRGSRWYSIWTIEMVDGEPRYPTEIAASADHALILPAWSRDGQRVAFTTVGSLPDIDPEFGAVYERSDIWVMDTDGGSRIRLTDGHSTNFGPAWGPNGRVYFTSMRSGHETIWSVMPTTGMMPTTTPGSTYSRVGAASKVRAVSSDARDGSRLSE